MASTDGSVAVRGDETPALPEGDERAAAAEHLSLELRRNHTSEEICSLLGSTGLPPGDAPSAAELQALGDCDAEKLYYGIGVAPDYVMARKCAFAAVDAGALVFDGSSILMMIYANGKGVPTNLIVAMKMACITEGAPAELEGRLRHLRDWLNGLKTGAEEFDFCDDFTSGFMTGHCSAHQERMTSVPRDARKRAAIARFPAAEANRLQKAAAAFFDARAANEVDLSGTMRAALEIEERATLEEDFIAALEHLPDPTFRPDAGAFKNSDAELNRIFGEVMRGDAGGGLVPFTTITHRDIRATQRLWIVYRDAWVALAAKVRPDIPREVWRSWLTEERANMLGAFIDEP